MFNKNSNEEINDRKFIDFQGIFLQSSLWNLIFITFIHFDIDLIPDNLDSLLYLYYETFIEDSKIVHCEISTFMRKKFGKQLKIDARIEFGHCAYSIRSTSIISGKGTGAKNLESVSFTDHTNVICYVKLRKFVEIFVDRKWL